MLTHLQISEALQKTLWDVIPKKIVEYTSNKLDEFVTFSNKYALQEPNLQALGSRVRLMARALHGKGKGVTPFVFGRDYAPDMMHD